MSKVQVDSIVNKNDDGAPNCPKGLIITGVTTSDTLRVGTAVTISAGIVTATSFVGSGKSLTGISGKATAMAIVFS